MSVFDGKVSKVMADGLAVVDAAIAKYDALQASVRSLVDDHGVNDVLQALTNKLGSSGLLVALADLWGAPDDDCSDSLLRAGASLLADHLRLLAKQESMLSDVYHSQFDYDFGS